MNIIDKAQDLVKNGIQNAWYWAMGIEKDPFEAEHIDHQNALAGLKAYYDGRHKEPLKVSMLGKNYNVISNYIRVIVDRSVSMLVGAGVEFDLPGQGESEQDAIIKKAWDANKKDILLHDLVQFGCIYGTAAIKIIPDKRKAGDGSETFRLDAINPFMLSMITAPNDIEDVLAYVIRWQEGKTQWREVTSKGVDDFDENGAVVGTNPGWTVRIQKSNRETRGKWVDEDVQNWEYDFSPIAHCKNLPNAGTVYGYSDVEGIVDLQDKYNEGRSNVNKILSLQAFSQIYVTGGKFPRAKDSTGQEYIDMNPASALEFQDKDAKVGILQPSGDMQSSRDHINDIRRDIFEISATVDAETVKDKIGGGLTNFGLRVLFKNELAKNATKQLLYGDLLKEVNRRMLVLSGYDGVNADPGKVKFGNPLPENDTEKLDALEKERTMGVVSLETAAKELGRDWEDEKERLAGEKKDTAGGNLIRDILAGK